MRRVAVLVCVLLGLSGCAATTTPTTAHPALVAVAREICPILWRWQLNVGTVMNDMSYETRRTDDADRRLERYLSAFDQARLLNAELDDEIRTITKGPFADLMVEDVVDGVVTGNQIIDDLQRTVAAAHTDGDSPEYGEIVPVIFLTFEKVIDVAKPELAGYGNAELIAAFMTVPQCQSGVKDADDGIPRYVPLS